VYGKIFESMYDGTLADNWQALITFQQMIVLASADGVVDMTPQAIARRTGIPLEVITEGVRVLECPDASSRTADMEGKRINRLDDHRDWGWWITNHEKYRNMADATERRARDAERKRKARENAKKQHSDASEGVRPRPPVSASVQSRPQKSAHTDTDTDTNTNTKAPHARIPSAIDRGFGEFWERVHRKEGKGAAKSAYAKAIARVQQERDWNVPQAITYLNERMTQFASSPQSRDEVKGTLHPATWLNQARYDDDADIWTQGQSEDATREAAAQAANASALKRRDEARKRLAARGEG